MRGDQMRPDSDPRPVTRSNRPGFTLAEMIIGITLLAIIGASAVPFYLKSLRSVAATSGAQDAMQSAQFGLDFISHDLRLAGQGRVSGQPLLVQMSDSAVTFNANIVTSDTSASTTGAYFDPNVADSLALALPSSKAVTLPRSTTSYPLTTYYKTGTILSDAETISFWMATDTASTAAAGTYALWRRVNNAAPSIVARGLVYPAGAPPTFQYFVASQDSVNTLIPYKSQTPAATYPYPLVYTTGATNDTMLTRVLEVRVSLTGMYKNPITGKITYRSINQQIPIENAGLPNYSACPGPPAPPTGITQYVGTNVTQVTADSVWIIWNASTDELSGYKNVRAYQVYRKLDTASSWGQSQFEVEAIGQAKDTARDYPPILTSPRYYIYGVVAENCTPTFSTVAQTTTPIFPN
jgi:prepilin-type N-terminal cleavage/methylation domain-containing protein